MNIQRRYFAPLLAAAGAAAAIAFAPVALTDAAAAPLPAYANAAAADPASSPTPAPTPPTGGDPQVPYGTTVNPQTNFFDGNELAS
jgi:hypothetical protein